MKGNSTRVRFRRERSWSSASEGRRRKPLSSSIRWITSTREPAVSVSFRCRCAYVFRLSSQHKQECSDVHNFASQEHSAREELQKLFNNCLGKQQEMEEENSLNISKCNKVTFGSSLHQQIVSAFQIHTVWLFLPSIQGDIWVNPNSALVFAGLVQAQRGQ